MAEEMKSTSPSSTRLDHLTSPLGVLLVPGPFPWLQAGCQLCAPC